MLNDDPAAAVVDLLAVRAPLYAELADLVIDVDELAPDEVARRILAAVAAADSAPQAGTTGAATTGTE